MKKYKFVLEKYYTEEQLNSIIPIMESAQALLGEDGVVNVKVKEDISVNFKADEGLVLHMVVNSDKFDNAGKTLDNPKSYADALIRAIAKAVEAIRPTVSEAAEKAKAGKALLDYLNDDEVDDSAPQDEAPQAPASTDRVFKNGKEVTDAEEKAKAKKEIDEAIALIEKETATWISNIKKAFSGTFSENFVSEFFKKYLE